MTNLTKHDKPSSNGVTATTTMGAKPHQAPSWGAPPSHTKGTPHPWPHTPMAPPTPGYDSVGVLQASWLSKPCGLNKMQKPTHDLCTDLTPLMYIALQIQLFHEWWVAENWIMSSKKMSNQKLNWITKIWEYEHSTIEFKNWESKQMSSRKLIYENNNWIVKKLN
jgi:hypothetical protein